MPDADPRPRKRAFDPVVDGATRVLVLGSLPGDASLKADQYYAHPQNGFWRLMAGVVVLRDLPTLPYAERLATLKAHGLGLWDVIADAERAGSLDTAIRDATPADLKTLVSSLPHLRAVAFNGARAARDGRRLLTGLSDLNLIDLPSSSAAHARPLAEKAEAWSILRRYLPEPTPTQT